MKIVRKTCVLLSRYYLAALFLMADTAFANTPGVANTAAGASEPVRIALMLGALAFVPALIMCMTSFLRIIIVLSMIRHGLGMPETPPNAVLMSLALFLTALSMGPTLDRTIEQGVTPFMNGQATLETALKNGTQPLRIFMLKQVTDEDLSRIYKLAKKPAPQNVADVGLAQLVPAFILGELRIAFTIGFVILLPFLLIDLVVSAILLSLGMMMVPPATISLPIKVLMFVLIDGWGLILEGVLGSFR